MTEFTQRKSNRLKGYNYSQAGCYFVTICIIDRHEILAQIVGDAHLGVPSIELTETGLMVERHVTNIDAVYIRLRVDKYVIMPNHVHLLLSISDDSPLNANGTPMCASPTKSTIAKAINAFKSLTSRQFGEPMWQRSYHDHVVRDNTEYKRIWNYIDTNPYSWTEDKYYVNDENNENRYSIE